jgi:hypothetical protein
MWSNNHSDSWEGPLVFIFTVWSHLIGGMGFYTTGLPELVCDNFLDMNNPKRDEPMHNNVMVKYIGDTNQGIPSQGYSYAFPFFGNVDYPLIMTLDISGLNV